MDVVVVGGHGKVARWLLALLAERGDRARGVIRNPAQAADLTELGAEPVVCDLEREELTEAVSGADAVVFAAGAGAGSGVERKRTVDFGGALKLIEAAKANGVSRYVMVSAIGVTDPDRWPDEMRPYYRAKADADAQVERSGLDYTIVRPGRLTDDRGTGLVERSRRGWTATDRSRATTSPLRSPKSSLPTTRSARRSICSTASPRPPRLSVRCDRDCRDGERQRRRAKISIVILPSVLAVS